MLDLDAATKELEAARKAFNECSYDKLAALHKEDINETSYLFCDDGRGEPIKGGPAPDVAFTISQMNRLGIETKRLAKLTSSQEPRPFPICN